MFRNFTVMKGVNPTKMLVTSTVITPKNIFEVDGKPMLLLNISKIYTSLSLSLSLSLQGWHLQSAARVG